MVIILTRVNKNDGTHRTELLIGCGELEERCIQGHEVGERSTEVGADCQ